MESLKIKTRLGDVQGCYYSLANLGVLEASLNNLSQAEQHFLKSLEIVRNVGDKGGEGEILINLRNLMIHQNRTSESERYLNQIKILQHQTGMTFLPNEG